MTAPNVNPDFLAGPALDPENPRTRIRFLWLDRHFGAGNWTEVFVDLFGRGSGTVRDRDGAHWDWWAGPGGYIRVIPAV